MDEPMAVSEKTILDVGGAMENARQMLALAYAPQPVKQPDGTFLHLCWRGRLHRGLKRLNEVRKQGDEAAFNKIEIAVERLYLGSDEAMQNANAAVEKYEATCRLLGEVAAPSTSLYPPDCTCAECIDANRNHRMLAAMGEARDALYCLLIPAESGVPPIVGLVKTADQADSRDRLWKIMKRLADGLDEYGDAAKELGITEPNWNSIWPC
jgi:hypothetical protein